MRIKRSGRSVVTNNMTGNGATASPVRTSGDIATKKMPRRSLEVVSPIVVSILLFSLVVLLFLPVVGHPLITLDDGLYIGANSVVQKGLTGEGFLWAIRTFHSANWHPVTWLSHMLDVEIFGLDYGYHHLTNVLFHAANSAMIFVLLWKMTGAVWRSILVALLFAVHPLHVQSVAWISERKDVLSTFFALFAAIQYVEYVKRNSAARYATVIIVFSLGLMAKPMIVTLPFVLLLLDFWPLRRFPRTLFGRGDSWGPGESVLRLFLEKTPLFLLAAGSCVVTYLAQQNADATMSMQIYPLSSRLANALISYVTYLWKTAWPSPLAIIYPISIGNPPLWNIAAAGVLLLLATIVSIRFMERHPHFAVGWFWFCGTLIPVIGLVQVGEQSYADRYMYLPSIGLFIGAAWAFPKIEQRKFWSRRVIAMLAGVWVVALAIVTWNELGYWHNSVTLYKRALDVTDDNRVARLYYGTATYNQGIVLADQGRKEEALASFEESLKMNPFNARLQYNLGTLKYQLGRKDEAVGHLRKALDIDPSKYEAHYQLGMVLSASGMGAEAAGHFRDAIRLGPQDPAFKLRVEQALQQSMGTNADVNPPMRN